MLLVVLYSHIVLNVHGYHQPCLSSCASDTQCFFKFTSFLLNLYTHTNTVGHNSVASITGPYLAVKVSVDSLLCPWHIVVLTPSLFFRAASNVFHGLKHNTTLQPY